MTCCPRRMTVLTKPLPARPHTARARAARRAVHPTTPWAAHLTWPPDGTQGHIGHTGLAGLRGRAAQGTDLCARTAVGSLSVSGHLQGGGSRLGSQRPPTRHQMGVCDGQMCQEGSTLPAHTVPAPPFCPGPVQTSPCPSPEHLPSTTHTHPPPSPATEAGLTAGPVCDQGPGRHGWGCGDSTRCKGGREGGREGSRGLAARGCPRGHWRVS